MSYQSIKAKAEVVRSETRVAGNTKGRIADIFDDLNDTKADKLEVQAHIDDLNEKNEALNDKVDNMGASGFKGEAFVTTVPTDYNPIQYPDGLYEKYDVRTAGTFTHFKNASDQPLVVTSGDLSSNIVYFSVTNGVAKVNKIPVQGTTAKTKFDPTDNVNTATMKAMSDRYDPLLLVNAGYLKKNPPIVEIPVTIDESNAQYGGKFLEANNTITNNAGYPNIGVVHNLDVSNAYRLEVTGMIKIGQDSKPAILGIKADGTIVTILSYWQGDLGSLQKIDITEYDKVSIQVVQGSYPLIKTFQYGAYTITDAKKYADDRFQVLDFFLNPYEVSEPITIPMPRPNENKNAFINTQWAQFPTPASQIHNGIIKIADISPDMTEITISGSQFDIAGEGILWLGIINTTTGAKVNLMSGAKMTGSYSFKVDTTQYDSIAYSRIEGNTTFSYRKTSKTAVKPNSVQEYIDGTGARISKKVFDPTDNTNPATMMATAKRYDRALDVLDSFVFPKGESEWTDYPFSVPEYKGLIYNTGGAAENQPAGACGEIFKKDLVGVSSLRVIGSDMEKYGNTVAWWLGYKADNTFDVLRAGVVTSGSASIKIDPKYTKYRYSRPLTADSKLQKKLIVELDPEKDSVLKRMSSAGAGYSGVLDLASVGLKETNTAEQNTAIINSAIEEEGTKRVQRIIMFPHGMYKIKDILLARNTILGGAGKNNTGLVAEVGTKIMINQIDGAVTSQEIFGLSFDGTNASEGVISIHNTFGLKIRDLSIYCRNQYAIKLKACLYHEVSDIYVDGGEFAMWNVTTLKMANNLNIYNRCYFVKSGKNCVLLEGGSNYVFNTCNFEDAGIGGDETTGGVRMIGISPGGEGVDVAFNNCWSEGVRGGYIYKFEKCKGNSVIRDSMMGNGGNGAGQITNAIVVDSSRVLLSGSTSFGSGGGFHPFPTNIRNIGGTVLIENPNINVDTAPNVGTLKKAVYA